jgi:hypothetical protein
MANDDVEKSPLIYGGRVLADASPFGALRITTGETALKAAATFWFVVTAIGQWIFVVYIVSFYGGAVMHGDMGRWGKFLTHGLIPGDHIGNLALALHLSLAAVITAGGPLQLIPQIRAHAPAFHRWTGRAYVVTALVTSICAPFGFDPDTFKGPFLNFLSFAESLFPLAIFELYLRTQVRAGVSGRIAMAAGLVFLTVATGVGVFGVYMSIWLPNI